MQHITPDGPSAGSLRLAGLRIDPVFDGPGRVMAREVLVRAGVEDGWACHQHLLDDEGRLAMAMGGFLVRSGERIALVDVGTGPIRTDVAEGGAFLDSLRTLGVEPADVTDVLFTHLHFDHVGWSTQRGEVVFPNATYRVHQADWDHFMTGPDAEPGAIRKLSPLTEQLSTFDSDHTVMPGLDARSAPGHTPGTTIYIASGDGARALLLGDVVHSIVELTEPDWDAVFDVDPIAARAVRDHLRDEIVDSGDVVAPAHLPGLAWGRVVTVGSRREFIQV